MTQPTESMITDTDGIMKDVLNEALTKINSEKAKLLKFCNKSEKPKLEELFNPIIELLTDKSKSKSAADKYQEILTYISNPESFQGLNKLSLTLGDKVRNFFRALSQYLLCAVTFGVKKPQWVTGRFNSAVNRSIAHLSKCETFTTIDTQLGDDVVKVADEPVAEDVVVTVPTIEPAPATYPNPALASFGTTYVPLSSVTRNLHSPIADSFDIAPSVASSATSRTGCPLVQSACAFVDSRMPPDSPLPVSFMRRRRHAPSLGTEEVEALLAARMAEDAATPTP
ncbi:MAG: hypothetical protein KBD64_01040 [Gammaproteobacteria bacterium]|nr:hypothetical protein [Gammaproteobacteria bacterium]